MILRRDHVAAAALLALGLAVLVLGAELPFGTPASPGPGMLPTLVAAVLMALAVVLLVQAQASPPFATIAWDDLPHAAIVMAAAGAAAATYTTLGFPVTFGLMLLALMWGVERLPIGLSLVMAAGVAGGTYLLLGAALKTPMPVGLLGF